MSVGRGEVKCWERESEMFYIVLYLGLSFLVSPCSWDVSFMNASVVFTPLGGTGWLEGAGVGLFPFSWVKYVLL